MINHPAQLRKNSSTLPERHALLQGDSAARSSALAALSKRAIGRGWHLFEGATYPDVTIFTPQGIIVVEGKRTEAGPTLDTTWLAGRHQMWRHIEGAWCARGSREVFGLFIVEGDREEVPQLWLDAANATLSSAALATSFPHRSDNERQQLSECFRGVVTWRQVCAQFGIAYATLPDTTADLPVGA